MWYLIAIIHKMHIIGYDVKIEVVTLMLELQTAIVASTCPYNTNSRFAIPTRLTKKIGIPALIKEGDLNDLRCFSDEQAKTNIEAFVEQLRQKGLYSL